MNTQLPLPGYDDEYLNQKMMSSPKRVFRDEETK
jgi:hypothetical protein